MPAEDKETIRLSHSALKDIETKRNTESHAAASSPHDIHMLTHRRPPTKHNDQREIQALSPFGLQTKSMRHPEGTAMTYTHTHTRNNKYKTSITHGFRRATSLLTHSWQHHQHWTTSPVLKDTSITKGQRRPSVTGEPWMNMAILEDRRINRMRHEP